jgi:recombination protein RecT
MTETVSTAVAKRDKPSPWALVASYRDEFAVVLPTHIRPDTWIRVAQGALKKGKRNQDGITELEIAANNNPAAFVVALRDAARLGLEPGTEEYYLTPRKVNGRNEIQGIVGYQGYIELMYRAGAVDSIVAEVVYTDDQFRYSPGQDEFPTHEIDWDADERGELRLVYAYARMGSGATSKVVVLNRAAIARIKRSSQGSSGEYSPWVLHPESMWLKSAIRQLKKWVPTSEEYRQALESVEARELAPTAAPAGFAPALAGPERHGDDWVEDDAIDAEVVEDEAAVEAFAKGGA